MPEEVRRSLLTSVLQDCELGALQQVSLQASSGRITQSYMLEGLKAGLDSVLSEQPCD